MASGHRTENLRFSVPLLKLGQNLQSLSYRFCGPYGVVVRESD